LVSFHSQSTSILSEKISLAHLFVLHFRDSIFDKGLNLPKPEVVPFRLTQNMLDAFGPAGADGIYSGSLQVAMSTLRDNRDTLLSVLEPFLKDPGKRFECTELNKLMLL
jgi:phosphatidylinositol kinase/protein kinase (PI-3  family)